MREWINYSFVAMLTTDSVHDNITRFTLKSLSIRWSLFFFYGSKTDKEANKHSKNLIEFFGFFRNGNLTPCYLGC